MSKFSNPTSQASSACCCRSNSKALANTPRTVDLSSCLSASYTFSGRPADQLSRAITRAVPEFLREGGYCQMVCNWAVVAGQDWREIMPQVTDWRDYVADLKAQEPVKV